MNLATLGISDITGFNAVVFVCLSMFVIEWVEILLGDKDRKVFTPPLCIMKHVVSP